MNRIGSAELEPYLAHLKALPFVSGAQVERGDRKADLDEGDGRLRLRTPRGEYALRIQIKRTHLTRPLVDGLLTYRQARAKEPWVLLAPYVGVEIGRYLRANDTNYLDAAGNCYLAIGRDYLALVEGRRPVRKAPHERGFRGPGHQILFTILARPELLNAPVRVLAGAAGVGKTAVAEMLTRLDGEGLVGADRDGRRQLRPRVLLDRWIAGYATTVRPRLLMGRFRTNDPGPEQLEQRIERELATTAIWAWGGGAAAMRMTGYYRGSETVLHLAEPLPNLGKRLRAIPAGDGPLTVLGAPGRVAFEGIMLRTVHPLLVYTELLATGDERAREAAEEVWNRYLAVRTR